MKIRFVAETQILCNPSLFTNQMTIQPYCTLRLRPVLELYHWLKISSRRTNINCFFNWKSYFHFKKLQRTIFFMKAFKSSELKTLEWDILNPDRLIWVFNVHTFYFLLKGSDRQCMLNCECSIIENIFRIHLRHIKRFHYVYLMNLSA